MGKDSKIKHTFKLQILDANAIAFPDTTFDYTVDISKKDDSLILQLPLLNFKTLTTFSPNNSAPGNLVTGGLVNTFSNPLPEKLRPKTAKTFLLSINDNYLQSYSVPYFPPITIPGLNLTIDTYGNLTISAPTTFQAIIPAGSHTLNSQSIQYLTKNKCEKLKIKDFVIQPNFTNFTGFTGRALNDGIRDSHVNDSFDNRLAWSWTDNSAQTDKTNNQMDVYVATGHVCKDKMKISKPIRLTNLPTNVMGWDTAVAFNRINPKNVVVSFAILDHSVTPNTATLNVCVSNDSGHTWTSPINIDPSVTFLGDARGVIADRYGNFWFSSTSRNTDSTIINLSFYASSNGGNTWTLIYQTTDSSDADGQYDYPQITVGNDGQGNYGLWFVSDFYNSNGDNIARLGFIPTTGLGIFGAGSYIILDKFVNQVTLCNIYVRNDGTVYLIGNPTISTYNTNYGANTLITKTPGILDSSLLTQPYTILNTGQNLLPTSSYPVDIFGYFIDTVNDTIYDEERKALYTVFSEQPNGGSQDIYLYMVVSFDNGITWSEKIQLATTNKNNRGFSSISLDNGALSLGWYDSRKSKDSTSEQYYGAYITKKQLDKFINKLKK